MKTIGILGGLGPEATVDYYKEIIKQVSVINNDGSLNYPEIVIYSVNMAEFISMLEKGDFNKAIDYISDCILKLANTGVDFTAISANTPHLFFKEIQSNVPIPLISIVETCKEKAKDMGLKRCGLFGTKFTMNATFFYDVFAKENIRVISPDENEIQRINNLLFTELEKGIFKKDTKTELLGMVSGMIERQRIDSLILGCTEFPLMFDEEKYLGIPFLNTTRIHVAEIVKQCLVID